MRDWLVSKIAENDKQMHDSVQPSKYHYYQGKARAYRRALDAFDSYLSDQEMYAQEEYDRNGCDIRDGDDECDTTESDIY